MLLLLLALTTQGLSDDTPIGIVAHGHEKSNQYLFQYQSRILECFSRNPCDGLVDGRLFVATNKFRLDRELVEYLVGDENYLRSCPVRQCVEHKRLPSGGK
jgi:hypothetical protein